MFDLIKIEFKKIMPYSTFWVIFILVFALIPAVFYGIGQIQIQGAPFDLKTMYTFPGVWNNLTYLASWFNLLIGMVVVILVCNEFSFKTFRQHVIDGQSKSDFIIAKIWLMVFLALCSTVYIFIIGALFGLITTTGSATIMDDIHYLGIYFIQALGYMSVGLIIATLIRSTALSIIIFMLSILIESIVQIFVPNAIAQYFPMEIIANLTPNPLMNAMMVPGPTGPQPAIMMETIPLSTNVMVAGIYIVLIWGIAYFILTKKDIK
jgi:ABC-type transport system involved in multi-copper enzyme maturation permease subunit